MLLAAAERRLGVVGRLARLIADPRDPAFVTHSIADILQARMLAIACGYEDADDLDHLRTDPGFKLACGRLPDSGPDLCSQPTVSRWKNAPTLREVVRLTYALVDLYCASYPRPPEAVTLDIDDTVDVVHGHQQLCLFNAHHDERCFMPIHVYDVATSRPVAMILRPNKTPSGVEVRGHLRRLVRRIRSHWPTTRLTIRGDGHYGRPEVMAWCEANGVDFIFGLPGNAVLARLLEEAADDVRVRGAEADAPSLRRYAETRYGAKSWRCKRRLEEAADDVRVRRAEADAPSLRRYAETRYGAKSWRCKRRVAARIEATTLGLDIRCVVTSLASGSAEWLYDALYCARGQAENLIKLHKGQLASDRTSCRSALPNQVRLVLHTAAYWLMLTVRDVIPRPQPLASAEFTTLRLRLLKVAARITETATRVRIAFAAACPEAALFRGVARSLQLAGP